MRPSLGFLVLGEGWGERGPWWSLMMPMSLHRASWAAQPVGAAVDSFEVGVRGDSRTVGVGAYV